jgi:hypothetical protein
MLSVGATTAADTMDSDFQGAGSFKKGGNYGTCRGYVGTSSIGHPPLSLASPVNLCLQVGPRALSEKKRIREQGVKNLVCQSVRP